MKNVVPVVAGSAVRDVHGTPVVPGVAYGPVIRPAPRPELPTVHPEIPDTARAAEAERFTAAAHAVGARLRARASGASGAASEVLLANAGLAEDRAWIGAATGRIRGGSDAVGAAIAATEQFATMFTKMGGRMAERVTDLRDIRDRVVAELSGIPEPGLDRPAEPSVLLADDLAPADAAGLDPTRIIGLATTLGGPTSHTAIIARQLGIPCVVAAAGLDAIPAGTAVLLDGSTGEV
ncbi:MAG: PEP-utilizing enzyme, partial [Rhodococcus sp. (in: high G+C Gram-positive bacteria)]|uniref:PEP-utilizing enzyme n=1 Tax=Rhodococcus sp. TaxID=1831 RepID=UPI003BB62CC3